MTLGFKRDGNLALLGESRVRYPPPLSVLSQFENDLCVSACLVRLHEIKRTMSDKSGMTLGWPYCF